MSVPFLEAKYWKMVRELLTDARQGDPYVCSVIADHYEEQEKTSRAIVWRLLANKEVVIIMDERFSRKEWLKCYPRANTDCDLFAPPVYFGRESIQSINPEEMLRGLPTDSSEYDSDRVYWNRLKDYPSEWCGECGPSIQSLRTKLRKRVAELSKT